MLVPTPRCALNYLLQTLVVLLSILIEVSDARGKGGKKKPSGDGGGDTVVPEPDKTPHKFGTFVAQNPNIVFLAIVTVQFIFGTTFSIWFKYRYIHHPDKQISKLVIE